MNFIERVPFLAFLLCHVNNVLKLGRNAELCYFCMREIIVFGNLISSQYAGFTRENSFCKGKVQVKTLLLFLNHRSSYRRRL